MEIWINQTLKTDIFLGPGVVIMHRGTPTKIN